MSSILVRHAKTYSIAIMLILGLICAHALAQNSSPSLDDDIKTATEFLSEYFKIETTAIQDSGLSYDSDYNSHVRLILTDSFAVSACRGKVVSVMRLEPTKCADEGEANRQITDADVFSRVLPFLKYWHLPVEIEKYTFNSVKHPLTQKTQECIIKLSYDYNGLPVAALSVFIARVAYCAERPDCLFYLYPDIIVPENDNKEVVSKKGAVVAVQDFFRKRFCTSHDQYIQGLSAHPEIRKVIASDDHRMLFDADERKREKTEYYYCWEVKYSCVKDPGDVTMWVRIDTGEVIGGDDNRYR